MTAAAAGKPVGGASLGDEVEEVPQRLKSATPIGIRELPALPVPI